MSARLAQPLPLSIERKIAAFRPRPRSAAARAALVAVNLACVTFFLLSYTPHGVGFGPYRIDLDVYRIGARVWLSGGSLYGRLPPTLAGPRLRFTYPPIAAVMLSPLTMVPMVAATTMLTLVTIVLTALVLRLFLRRLIAPEAGSWWALAWLLPPALFFEPVRNTLAYGQVNVALMAMVSLDCMTERPRWPRGALVGFAAAVKLTPAAFMLFFLVQRDYRAARNAAVSFAATTGAGLLLAWPDSVRYWTSVIFQVGRTGNIAYAANQSIAGVMARAGGDPRALAATALWLALSAIVVAVACRGMRIAFAAGQNAWALALNAFAALLISPISWSHHWVWGVPAILTLAVLGWRQRAHLPLVTAAAGLAVFFAAPQWWFPSGNDTELRWAAWQQAVGSAYAGFAAFVLVSSACVSLIPAPGQRSSPGEGRQLARDHGGGEPHLVPSVDDLESL
jgi:alpha-1,2-mannosyltransferase